MSVLNTHIAAQGDRGAEALGRIHFGAATPAMTSNLVPHGLT
jgi:hypothetical protein